MSRNSLPDLLGLRQFTDNGSAPLRPLRRILNLLGEVTVTDNPVADRIDLLVGAVKVLRPPTITANDAAYNPPGFDTCSVVMVVSTLSGARIEPLADADVIRTLRRTWINVGSVPVEIVSGAETRLLLPNRSLQSFFDKVAEVWVLQAAPE